MGCASSHQQPVESLAPSAAPLDEDPAPMPLPQQAAVSKKDDASPRGEVFPSVQKPAASRPPKIKKGDGMKAFPEGEEVHGTSDEAEPLTTMSLTKAKATNISDSQVSFFRKLDQKVQLGRDATDVESVDKIL